MVSVDIQSLFTSIPIKDCIRIIKRKLQENNILMEYLELLEHCLTSGYLMFNQKFYLRIDGNAMGSPVSPIITDIYMENFEEMALSSEPCLPRISTYMTLLQLYLRTVFIYSKTTINNNIQFRLLSFNLAFLNA